MAQWLKRRFEIVKLTLDNPVFLALLGIWLACPFLLAWLSPLPSDGPLSRFSGWTPWVGWIAGGLLLLWTASVEYSVKRKEVFDQTSKAFFKAYLESLIRQGHDLFHYSEEKDFYSRISGWQHRVVEGIAIGLGPEASQKYYQKTDIPFQAADGNRQAMALRTGEALCRRLHENLEELKRIRMGLEETPSGGKAGEDVKRLEEPKKMLL
jgi:hypothetical protein